MFCNDCGHKLKTWSEYCNRCGADLFQNEKKRASRKHTIFERIFKILD